MGVGVEGVRGWQRKGECILQGHGRDVGRGKIANCRGGPAECFHEGSAVELSINAASWASL